MDQPPRSAIDQRQSGRDDRMVGRVQPDLLRKREPQHHARLLIVGQALARRAVDQRIEIGQPPQGLAGDRDRESRGRRATGSRAS